MRNGFHVNGTSEEIRSYFLELTWNSFVGGGRRNYDYSAPYTMNRLTRRGVHAGAAVAARNFFFDLLLRLLIRDKK